ncbi:MAG TPA: 4-(cytidine 5'-diphospho)-2-C-methyl-D-erythritol kinase [Peptococcaceae bacterium]|nr:4-(cytidine 5'-diphospho)-2-C-methyl-D-erythritol kinase [Peptococcaceae bacterium]
MIEKSLTLDAPAKINLSLAITGKRTDGYHNLQTIFQSVSLADRVQVTLTKTKDISCLCGNLSGEQNLAYQAARLFWDSYQTSVPGVSLSGIEIKIEKNIPLQAGLAGGSSDAAAVLRALNLLSGNPFSMTELLWLACRCGSDTAFCLRGGTQWGEGTGTDLSPLPPAPKMDMVLAKPEGGISTAEAYRLFDESCRYASLERELWVKLLKEGATDKIGQHLFNSLEKVAFQLLPEIKVIKDIMLQEGCLGALMSGSGSAVFGIAKNKEHGQKVVQALQEKGVRHTWLVKTLNTA